MHAELFFFDPTTTLAKIAKHMRLVLECDYIFRSESEGQPPLDILIVTGALAIAGLSYRAP